MGKKKRTSDDHNQIDSSSDTMLCASGMELITEEKPRSSLLDNADSSKKLQNSHQPSTANHHQSLSRSIFLKRSRHHFGHHYSRRGGGSPGPANPSTTTRGKATMRDEKLSFKLAAAAAQCNSELGRLAEHREKASLGLTERISCSDDDVMPTGDLAKTLCWICRKLLIRKYYHPEVGLAAVLSDVAVMACGHTYHDECLENKTLFEDKREPPCPLCKGSVSQLDVEIQDEIIEG